jgi:hypothetical protein
VLTTIYDRRRVFSCFAGQRGLRHKRCPTTSSSLTVAMQVAGEESLRCRGPEATHLSDVLPAMLKAFAGGSPRNGAAKIVEILQTGSALHREENIHQIRDAVIDAQPCIRSAHVRSHPTGGHQHHRA